MQDYKKLTVWSKSHELVLEVYKVINCFPAEERYGLCSQIKRAAVSIPANIAEGAGRFTKKDFASFLQIALGSTHELEYLMLLSFDLNFISKAVADKIENLIIEIKAMLIGLIKSIRSELK